MNNSSHVLPERSEKRRRRRICLFTLLIVIVIAIITTIIAVLIVFLKQKNTTPTSSTSVLTESTTTTRLELIETTSGRRESTRVTHETVTSVAAATESSLSSDATTESTGSTEVTTNVNCVSPYEKSPTGECVNVLIDFNNCGTVGYVCSANYSSCSGGRCSDAPSIQLKNPIPIFLAALNGSVDDTFYNVTVPFNITLYNTTTNVVQITTNGVLCLGHCSNTYTETRLPTNEFNGATALAYWDDLYIYENTSQGIYYQSEGNTPNRTLIFEYYCSHYQQPREYYHFQIVFFEDMPGIVQFIYYDISDSGSSCTVGVQSASRGPFIQYCFDQVNSITNNMVLIFDTNTGRYTNSSVLSNAYRFD